MRSIMIFLGLLFIAGPAIAGDNPIVDYCLTTKDPAGCISNFLAEQQASQQNFQREMQAQQLRANIEQARIQANGMALFGAGNAFINGMNQGFQNMQHPISPPPAFVPMQLNPAW